jgi:urease accessory protein
LSAPLALLLLSDGRFPAGGFAHSGGLEAAVDEGLRVEDAPAFLRGRLEGIASAEAALAVASSHADCAKLLRLDLEAEARCPSPALRAASHRLGAQLLRSAAVVWPADETLAAYRRESSRTPRPVAFGVVARAAGLGDVELAAAYLYEDAAAVAAAAVRLLPIDSATTARWLVEAEPLIQQLAADACIAAAGDPRELPAGFAPALELRSLAHSAKEGRLFAS